MRLLASLLLASCYCISVAFAVTIRVKIPATSLLPNPNTLPASTHATLTSAAGPQKRAIIRKGNVLEFYDVQSTGSHLLDIYSHNYVFAPYRIDISSDSPPTITGAWETYRGTQWSDHGIPLVATPTDDLTITAKILSQRNFYEQREGFNVMSLLKNPMILFGIVALGITFGMPKLMENMDPETKAEFDEMQKKGPLSSTMKAMQGGGAGGGAGDGFDLAGFLAGSQSKSSGSTAGSAANLRERKK